MSLTVHRVSSADSPEAFSVYVATTSADIPSASAASVGDILNVKGPLVSDRKVYIAAAGPSGMTWVDTSGGIPAGDVTITGNLTVDGDVTAAAVKSASALFLKAGDPHESSLGSDSLTAARTWTLPDRDGGVVIESADGFIPISFGDDAGHILPTINAQSGRVAVQGGSTSVTVVNSLVTPGSIVLATLQSVPTNPVTVSHCVCTSGQVVIHLTGDPGGFYVVVGFMLCK